MKIIVFLVILLYITSVNAEYKKYYKVKNVSKEILFGPKTRIYNGMEATENQFPYMIFVVICHDLNDCMQCSSSLVEYYWVLTAAHCFETEGFNLKNIFLVGGKVDLTEYLQTRIDLPFSELVDEAEFGVQERRPVGLYFHPKYVRETCVYDFALLKLEKPFDSPNIEPIAISKEKMTEPMLCTLLGWGITENPTREYKLNYVLNKKTKKCARNPFICLKTGKNKKEGTCSGDSGSPLVCDNKVWGVASFYTYDLVGEDSCENSNEDYYSEIYAGLDWISERSSGNPSTAVTFKNIILLTGFWYFITKSLYIYNS